MLSHKEDGGIYSYTSLVAVKSLSFLKSRHLSRPNAPQASCDGENKGSHSLERERPREDIQLLTSPSLT